VLAFSGIYFLAVKVTAQTCKTTNLQNPYHVLHFDKIGVNPSVYYIHLDRVVVSQYMDMIGYSCDIIV